MYVRLNGVDYMYIQVSLGKNTKTINLLKRKDQLPNNTSKILGYH
jgi:hypothetical protein